MTVRRHHPHTFVLVDPGEPTPPDAGARIPDELLELEPGVHPATCPTCDGERYLETPGTAWHSARMDAWYPSLACSYRPCVRCNSTGEILDYKPPLPKTMHELDAPTLRRVA